MTHASLSALLTTLPAESTLAPHPPARKIVVLDDDPTGTQTVHNIPVLTTWDTAALSAALVEPGPAFYVLTNSRALTRDAAVAQHREIGAHLRDAARRTGADFSVVSRSDSTLRGHYPAETDALAAALGGGFDGTLIVPAFFDGGRYTIGDIHYVASGDTLVPAGETEFARDAAFGYRASDLRAWVEEKTAGRIPARTVASVTLQDLRAGGPAPVADRLRRLRNGAVAIVNAAARSDLAVLTHALAAVEAEGRRFLFRTAADFVAAYAALPRRPLLSAAELIGAGDGGLLVAGSYVGKTSAQLEALFAAEPALARVELAVPALLDAAARPAAITRCIHEVETALRAGRPVALYTSRTLVTGADAAASLAIGGVVSSSLVAIVQSLAVRPRWLVAKGGITSSDIATRALGLRRARVLGQALPGVPVWQCGPESKWPDLAYIVFPGNVGGPTALAELVAALARAA
jgi:uncharacterized protein YgbK (DUF1537 family)